MELGRSDIHNIAFESINERFSKGVYLGVEVTIDMYNGYINGPNLVGQVKNVNGNPKRMDNWKRLDSVKELINYISQNEGISLCDLIIDVTDAPNGFRGTCIHPYLVPHVAAWAGPILAHNVSRIIHYIMTNTSITFPKIYSDSYFAPRVGCVYFISDGTYIKVGHSYNLPTRLKCLQTASPYNLRVLLSINSIKPVELERRIHAELSNYKVRGEWFDITMEQVTKYKCYWLKHLLLYFFKFEFTVIHLIMDYQYDKIENSCAKIDKLFDIYTYQLDEFDRQSAQIDKLFDHARKSDRKLVQIRTDLEIFTSRFRRELANVQEQLIVVQDKLEIVASTCTVNRRNEIFAIYKNNDGVYKVIRCQYRSWPSSKQRCTNNGYTLQIYFKEDPNAVNIWNRVKEALPRAIATISGGYFIKLARNATENQLIEYIETIEAEKTIV